jgi:hypothetical protein
VGGWRRECHHQGSMALPLDTNDEWYEGEESTRKAMVAEVQRIRRRTRVHPIPVVLLAAALTAGIVYKFATKKRLVEAEIVMALSEGTMASDKRDVGIPVNDLKNYIANQLLPKAKLSELIERRDLFRLRKKLGMEFAIEQLRENLEIQIWHNSFLVDDEAGARSARIGLSYADTDPDLALEIARDLAQIVVQEQAAKQQADAGELAKQLLRMRATLADKLATIRRDQVTKQVELDRARAKGQRGIAEAFDLEIDALQRQAKTLEEQMDTIAQSRDLVADQIAATGLDMSLSIVEEHRPEHQESHTFVIVLITVVVGLGSLLGSALLIGAFDSRVHDVDDVERLGLPVLGHVPGFPGDTVGSLAARGALRRRVPSFLRWRSHK